MSKIYSRPRMVVSGFKVNKKENRKKQKIFKILFIIIIAFSTVKLVLNAILPVFDVVCKDKASSVAIEISNEQTLDVINKHNYEELFILEKDNSGNIAMIKSNVFLINQITAKIALQIQKEIDNRGREPVEINAGNFVGIKLFSGIGPEIPIKISTIGNVKTDLKSEFVSQGISQTLHRVYLQIDCEIGILTPYDDITESVTNKVLIMENVIVGNVPSNYYDLNNREKLKNR